MNLPGPHGQQGQEQTWQGQQGSGLHPIMTPPGPQGQQGQSLIPSPPGGRQMPMTGPQGQQEQPPAPGTPVLPRLQQMLDGFRKVDPPTTKQLPVEADVPEFLVQLGLSPEARELDWVIGDLTMIACYYLLRIGEYTTKGTHNNSKQTEEFKMGDITFFAKDNQGNLRCLPRDATGMVQAWVGHFVSSIISKSFHFWCAQSVLKVNRTIRNVWRDPKTSAFSYSTYAGIVCDPSIEFIINRP